MGEIFTRTYKDIHRSAKLITSRKGSNTLDLINTTYISLQKKPAFPTEPDQFIKYFSRSMKLMHSLPDSPFYRQYRSRESALNHDPIDERDHHSLASSDDENIPSHLSLKQVDQYKSLQAFKKSLPLHLQALFDLYYINELRCPEIHAQLIKEGYDITRHRVFSYVKQIKVKFESWKSNQRQNQTPK
jgi:hypothetical protein